MPHGIPASVYRLPEPHSVKPVEENKPVDARLLPRHLLISLEKYWLTQAWAEATRIQVFIGWQVITHQEENSKEVQFRKMVAVAHRHW